MKTSSEMVLTYLKKVSPLKYTGIVSTDNLSGWEMYNKEIPEHLYDKKNRNRFLEFIDGQTARKKRNRDKVTHIYTHDSDGSVISKTYRGLVPVKRCCAFVDKKREMTQKKIDE